MSKNINKNDKNNLKFIYIFIAALIALILLIIGGISEYGAEKEVSGEDAISTEALDAEAYARHMEAGIAELCENVKGVNDVKVFVTLSGGYTAVYAQNSQSSSSGYKNEFVLSGSGSSEKPLLVGYSVPEIKGVGIVCGGGGDSNKQQEIISLVSAAIGISSNKIYVSEG